MIRGGGPRGGRRSSMGTEVPSKGAEAGTGVGDSRPWAINALGQEIAAEIQARSANRSAAR
jgi:hypothetical protein